jgi:UDP-N-acetyl-D-glucosamine dehydrogenase
LEKIQNRTANVLIFGAGYVGLPLAVKSANAGFPTIVYDTDQFKIKRLENGESHIPDVSGETITELKNLRFRWYLENIGGGYPLDDPYPDIIVICVPTPLNKTKDPDVSYIVDVVEKIKEEHILWADGTQLVILESTVYPGFTRECLAGEFSLDDDTLFAFSPERVDPGNSTYNISNTPKLVGGITPEATEVASAFYGSFIDEVVSVKSCEIAETAKLLENTYRMVNIGLVNEFALVCQKLGISVWDVIEAASTKPFGFTPFYPGPGIGGHCVPVDPHYLEWKLRTLNHGFKFIELAEQINSGMPKVVVDMVSDALNNRGRAIKGSTILVVGVAYKSGINDVRESPAIDIIEMLRRKQARVHYYDPHVERIYLEDSAIYMNSVIQLDSHGFDTFDCAVVISGHKDIDYNVVCKVATTVVDTRNVIPSVWEDRVTRL